MNSSNQPDITEDPFAEYYQLGNPSQQELAGAWQAAIGLQDVDGLRPSRYLFDTARRTIEGEIPLSKAHELIDSYYETKPHRSTDRTVEADKVATRIAQILAEPGFSFSAGQFLSIHHRLFTGIYSHAGKIRDYNISKKEWVLDGETVTYANALDAKAILEYDLKHEKEFNTADLGIDQHIEHLSHFASRLWQIHPFSEGNTRTTAVFLIKYLRMQGFTVSNVPFAENAWFFRNALVRANYENIAKGIHETTEYLTAFLRNVLLNESNELRNRHLHIRWQAENVTNTQKQDIRGQKQDIQQEKQDIGNQKQDIRVESLTALNHSHARKLFGAFGLDGIFSRKDVVEVLGITASPASALIAKFNAAGLLTPVRGQGKGKYKFAVEP